MTTFSASPPCPVDRGQSDAGFGIKLLATSQESRYIGSVGVWDAVHGLMPNHFVSGQQAVMLLQCLRSNMSSSSAAMFLCPRFIRAPFPVMYP